MHFRCDHAGDGVHLRTVAWEYETASAGTAVPTVALDGEDLAGDVTGTAAFRGGSHAVSVNGQGCSASNAGAWPPAG
jgi:hypothetical protein